MSKAREIFFRTLEKRKEIFKETIKNIDNEIEAYSGKGKMFLDIDLNLMSNRSYYDRDEIYSYYKEKGFNVNKSACRNFLKINWHDEIVIEEAKIMGLLHEN